MATSVERTLIQAQTRKTNPTATTSSRIPRNSSQNCDHHEMRARCRMRSPSTRDSSMYDTSAEVACAQVEGGHPLERELLALAEAVEEGAVDVEHAEHAFGHQGNHDLAARRRVACDVP